MGQQRSLIIVQNVSKNIYKMIIPGYVTQNSPFVGDVLIHDSMKVRYDYQEAYGIKVETTKTD